MKKFSKQQEKIDKLEKKNEQLKRFWEPIISKFEGDKFSTAPNKIALDALTEAFDIFSENEELKEENKSLRSDLEWLVESARKHPLGTTLKARYKEIRTRNKLDEV